MNTSKSVEGDEGAWERSPGVFGYVGRRLLQTEGPG